MKEKYSYYYDPRLTGGFHVLHRLDSVTSGAICVPLNYYSQNFAAKAFENNQVKKYYLALVYGIVKFDEIKKCAGVKIDRDNEIINVDVPIGDDLRNHGYKRSTVHDKIGNKLDFCANAQKSRTMLRILEYGTYKGRDCTKVILKPITGKRHQLRVVMDYLGYPIVGDTNYGVDDFDTYRTMLHSYKLEIRINTKEREFIKGKAMDPFLNNVDPDWKPHTIINELKI
jgi:23S rRNA-/tRNA-specific pseudouridylate synthase